MLEHSIWAVLFPLAFLLAFPPRSIKGRGFYYLALVLFAAGEAFLLRSAFAHMADPDFDDGASVVLVVPMFLLPAALLLSLLVLRALSVTIRKMAQSRGRS